MGSGPPPPFCYSPFTSLLVWAFMTKLQWVHLPHYDPSMTYTRTIFFTIKGFFSWWSFPHLVMLMFDLGVIL